jgi:hypothetical protein
MTASQMIGLGNPAQHGSYWSQNLIRFCCIGLAAMAACLAGFGGRPCHAVNPESPEVRELVDRGLKYLEKNTDERLGGRCLVALAFLKNGASPNHPRIREAVAACEQLSGDDIRADSVYSHGLAIIFLAELDPNKYHQLLEQFAGAMADRQKPNGAWGYDVYKTGDTSQTQYAVLAYWQLMQAGVAPKVSSVEACANWLLRTQDPSGGWGYQGNDPGPEKSELQKQDPLTVSLFAAGMGSTLISANMLGTLEPGKQAEPEVGAADAALPSALKAVDGEPAHRIRTLAGGSLDRDRVIQAMTKGKQFFDQHFHEMSKADYPYYMLYAVERYKSFEEYLGGQAEIEPEWYQAGYEFIKSKMSPEGSVTSPAGDACATSFAILFLVRSTQQSIKTHLGEGTLIGGRGLSADLSRMALKQGRLVMEQKPTEVDNFLKMLESAGGEELDALLSDATIDVATVTREDARRLEQLVKTGSPEARLLAVKALAKLRDLDYVPALLFALSDPDKQVVRAARDGLRYVSRQFEGFGPPDDFTQQQQFDAVDAWKNWYRRVRPDAPLEP